MIDLRKHQGFGPSDQPSRAAFNALSMSINDAVPVANETERAQLVADLTAIGQAPSTTRPLYVHRADAPETNRLEFHDGSGWRPVAPYRGPGTGTSNIFGQIAFPHGLWYVPKAQITPASADLLEDPTVTESAIRDYTPVLWAVNSTDIIVRFVNRLTNAWGGAGARFGVMWTAQ